MTLRRRPNPEGLTTDQRLSRAEQVARNHARRLQRLELEVGILRPLPPIHRKERAT
jgi:hypothetical protein